METEIDNNSWTLHELLVECVVVSKFGHNNFADARTLSKNSQSFKVQAGYCVCLGYWLSLGLCNKVPS